MRSCKPKSSSPTVPAPAGPFDDASAYQTWELQEVLEQYQGATGTRLDSRSFGIPQSPPR